MAAVEKEIVAKLNQLHETSSPKSEDLWLMLSQLKIGGVEILSTRFKEGFVSWIWCRSESAAAKLEQLDNDKKLGNLFIALLRCLPVSNVPKISEIKLYRFNWPANNLSDIKLPCLPLADGMFSMNAIDEFHCTIDMHKIADPIEHRKSEYV